MYRYSEADLEKQQPPGKGTGISERKNDYTRWSCEQRERAQKKCPQQRDFIKRI